MTLFSVYLFQDKTSLHFPINASHGLFVICPSSVRGEVKITKLLAQFLTTVIYAAMSDFCQANQPYQEIHARRVSRP